MQRIELSEAAAVQPVLAEQSAPHLAVAALLAGRVPGRLWADDPACPSLALAQTQLHYFVGGGERPGAAAQVQALLADVLLPEAQAAGQPGLMLHASAAAWAAGLDDALRDLLPITEPRQVYTRPVSAALAAPAPPPSFALRPADAALLADESITGLAALREEMCSERESVAAFLAESFGVCAVHLADRALAGWCLSEYNLPDRCEVGIATAPPYQRQGLATALTHALLAAAGDHGLRQVGWHCWARNTASAATARKAGFTLAAEEVVRLRW